MADRRAVYHLWFAAWAFCLRPFSCLCKAFPELMSDDKEGGYGSWGKVPVWDGSPMTWRAFQREMSWWLSSLDLEGTKK